MENNARIVQRDTGAWRLQVWTSFGIALLVCGTGLAWLPGGDLDRAFMVMGYFFCLSSAFVLSKYVRDSAAAPSDTPAWSLVVWGGFGLAMALTGWGLWRMEIKSLPWRARSAAMSVGSARHRRKGSPSHKAPERPSA